MYFYALKELMTLHWRAQKPLETLISMTERCIERGKGRQHIIWPNLVENSEN